MSSWLYGTPFLSSTPMVAYQDTTYTTNVPLITSPRKRLQESTTRICREQFYRIFQLEIITEFQWLLSLLLEPDRGHTMSIRRKVNISSLKGRSRAHSVAQWVRKFDYFLYASKKFCLYQNRPQVRMFTFCLRKKLNNLRKTFLNSRASIALGQWILILIFPKRK